MPVTVTVNVPAVVPLQARVEVWAAPSTTPAGLSVQVRTARETVEVRATVPVNPFTGETVIVEVADPPALAAMLVGLAATVKSVTV